MNFPSSKISRPGNRRSWQNVARFPIKAITFSVVLASLFFTVYDDKSTESVEHNLVRLVNVSSERIYSFDRGAKRSLGVEARSDPQLKSMLVDCQQLVVETTNKNDTSANEWIQTQTTPSFLMHTHPADEDALSKEMIQRGCYECDLIPYVVNAVQSKPGSVFIDIGGNMGLYALSAASVGAEVVTFEPVALSYQKICESALANPGFEERISVVPRVLSNQPGVAHFNLWTGNYAGISTGKVRQNMTSSEENQKEGESYAQAITLSSLEGKLLPLDRPVIVKIDVEGAECEVLEGALSYLRKVEILYLQIELNYRRSGGRCSRLQQVADFLAKEKALRPFILSKRKIPLDPSNAMDWKSPKPFGNFDVGWFPTQG